MNEHNLLGTCEFLKLASGHQSHLDAKAKIPNCSLWFPTPYLQHQAFGMEGASAA